MKPSHFAFVKMHGCGNDYVYIDAIRDPAVAALLTRADWPRLVRRISERHKGVGSDGVIAICKPSSSAARRGAHVRMRMFNADGSESEMCGNGVRCVAKFAHDRLGFPFDPLKVETGRGVLTIHGERRRGKLVGATVDMGEPILNPARMGVRRRELAFLGAQHHIGIESPGGVFIGVLVSMGNPHFCVFESWTRGVTPLSRRDVSSAELDRLGPTLERHPAFAHRMNIHIASIISRTAISMRTWERGAGLTQACGTGACAVAVAACLTGRAGPRVDVQLPGGTLQIRWEKPSNHVFMTGEAVDVFEGSWPL